MKVYVSWTFIKNQQRFVCDDCQARCMFRTRSITRIEISENFTDEYICVVNAIELLLVSVRATGHSSYSQNTIPPTRNILTQHPMKFYQVHKPRRNNNRIPVVEFVCVTSEVYQETLDQLLLTEVIWCSAKKQNKKMFFQGEKKVVGWLACLRSLQRRGAAFPQDHR